MAYSQCYVDGSDKVGRPGHLPLGQLRGDVVARARARRVASLGPIDCSTMTNCLVVAGTAIGLSNLTLYDEQRRSGLARGSPAPGMGTVGTAGVPHRDALRRVGALAKGHAGVVTTTINGGLTWRALVRLAGTLTMSGVSCYTAHVVRRGRHGVVGHGPRHLSTSTRSAALAEPGSADRDLEPQWRRGLRAIGRLCRGRAVVHLHVVACHR